MRNRLPLFLNELTLEEILYLEEELDRRKEKHRRHYSVLVVQTDKPIMRAENSDELMQFTRDVRRYVSGSSAVGGGVILAFSPEMSLALFNTVADASRATAALLTALPELNGKYEKMSLRFGVKMGLATGLDMLTPGSQRSIRRSALVTRAHRLAWRCATNSLLMDQNSYNELPFKHTATLAPIDADGESVYQALPGLWGMGESKYDNESLIQYLKTIASSGVSTLKYDIERIEPESASAIRREGTKNPVRLILEAYDPRQNRNVSFTQVIEAGDFADRMDVVKRIVNSMELALVRHELSIGSTL